MEFEGSEAGIVKNLWKMKVLGGVAGRRRESLQGGETARPGSNIVENVRFGAPGAFPGPWRRMPPPGPSFWTVQAWSWDPKMRAGNLLGQPTGSNPTVSVLGRCCTRIGASPRSGTAWMAQSKREQHSKFVCKRIGCSFAGPSAYTVI